MCHCSTLAKKIVPKLIELGASITIIESCTDGKLFSFIADEDTNLLVLNSSHVPKTTESKIALGLHVSGLSTEHSEEVAKDMAELCLKQSNVNLGIGVTGRLECENTGGRNVVYYAIVSPELGLNIIEDFHVNKHNPVARQKDIICRQVLKRLLDGIVV